MNCKLCTLLNKRETCTIEKAFPGKEFCISCRSKASIKEPYKSEQNINIACEKLYKEKEQSIIIEKIQDL